MILSPPLETLKRLMHFLTAANEGTDVYSSFFRSFLGRSVQSRLFMLPRPPFADVFRGEVRVASNMPICGSEFRLNLEL